MTRERRQFSRITAPFETRYRRFGDFGSGWFSATTLNLSAGGMRIRGPEAVETSTLLEIELQMPGRTLERCVLQGRVVWTSMQASGVTEIGIEFSEISPIQQIQIDQLVSFLRKTQPDLGAAL